MLNLQNILNFIELSGKIKSKRDFEKRAGIGNGTLTNDSKAQKDISVENVSKAIEKFGDEFIQYGYHIIDMVPLGIEYKMIATPEQVEKLKEFFGAVNSKPPDLSPEQVPVLLYGAMTELVKATQEIAKNTRRGLPEVLDKVHEQRKGKQSEMDMRSKPEP